MKAKILFVFFLFQSGMAFGNVAGSDLFGTYSEAQDGKSAASEKLALFDWLKNLLKEDPAKVQRRREAAEAKKKAEDAWLSWCIDSCTGPPSPKPPGLCFDVCAFALRGSGFDPKQLDPFR